MMQFLLKAGVILMSHLGTKRSRRNTLKPILKQHQVLGVPVQFASNCVGEEASRLLLI
jgi:phosphoglycerate kinase